MKKLVPVVALFLVALTALVWVGLASTIPVLGVAQLKTPKYDGGDVEVKDGQVSAVESIAPLKFTIKPRAGNEPQVLVETPRTVPENFKVGIDVGLRGSYDPETNLFSAYHISTKCPSKYEASKDGEATESGYSSGGYSSGGYSPAGSAAAGSAAAGSGDGGNPAAGQNR
jgi:hypothetical protein